MATDDIVMRQIKFTIEDQGYSFTDALFLTEEEFTSISSAELDALKQARFNNWLSHIQNPTQPDPISPSDQLQGIAEQATQLLQQTQQLAEQVGADISDQLQVVGEQQATIAQSITDALQSQG